MRRLEGIGLALLLLGALRIGYAQALGRAESREPPIDARFAGLKIALRQIPWDEPIAFTTRSPFSMYMLLEPRGWEQRALARASYALAPRVVLPDRRAARWIVFDIDPPSGPLADAPWDGAGLEVLWRSADGGLILARRSAP